MTTVRLQINPIRLQSIPSQRLSSKLFEDFKAFFVVDRGFDMQNQNMEAILIKFLIMVTYLKTKRQFVFIFI